MRECFVTVGPQYAGKSTFCEEMIALDPQLVLLSRDAVLIELFGSVYLDPYAGEHLAGHIEFFKRVRQALRPENARLIIDCWNQSFASRAKMCDDLRSYGADKITAWYFVTPLEVCDEWRKLRNVGILDASRPHLKKLSGDTGSFVYRMAYASYHQEPPTLNDGFDEIVSINAAQAILFSPSVPKSQST